MGINITALTERLRALSDEAYRLRSQDKTQPVDMIRLAKILSRQAQLEVQLAALGVPITPAQIQPMKHDELCPF